MSGTCPYCGAPLNFGLKFCIVCGRQSGDVVNKMGNLRTGTRQAEAARRVDETGQAVEYQIQKKTLRFGNKVRVLLQTIMYGFIAGTLFFCSVKVALEADVTDRVKRIVAPIIEPIVQKCQEVTDSAKNFVTQTVTAPAPPKKPVKHPKKVKKHTRK
jgi:hypothetical protein